MVWPQPRNLNGDASKPIITVYGGITVHQPAILGYHPGTRVLTHSQIIANLRYPAIFFFLLVNVDIPIDTKRLKD